MTGMRYVKFIAGACLACLMFAVGAAEVPLSAEREVRKVVQGQMDALAKDDARKAFSYAAPGIREKFGSPEAFLSMVRKQYPVVHRPAAVAFLKAQTDGESVIQRVQMTDQAGAQWLATYQLDRQKDGSWKISACVVLPNKGRTA
jgi:hypothetical protein